MMPPLSGRISPIGRGILGFAASFLVYSAMIILTTPNLSALTSVQVAFMLSPQIMIGIPLGVGLQAYLSSYLKRIPCPTRAAKPTLGSTAAGSTLSAFFSFFSLTQVGCCTLWLLYLSLLPSVVGVGVAGFLVRYSPILSNLSLVLVAVPVVFLLWKIRTARHANVS